MMNQKFIDFLWKLGFSKENIIENSIEDTFSYKKMIKNEVPLYFENEICINYIFIDDKHFEQVLLEKHTNIWNENKDSVFIVISENKSYLINAKVKPNLDNPLNKNIVIEKFAYGVNSVGFSQLELEKLSKDSIDSAYFFDFVIEQTKLQKTSEVDKDLLLNLIQLRNDLLNINDIYETIHLLILRCLFIKYLEDRGIYEKDYLLNILKTRSNYKLISAFEQIKRINGDIFKYDEFSAEDIHIDYIEKLEHFFSCFDYRTAQGNFFPYKFDKIPIQLISHVYEAFLSNTRKGNKGIYYTPTFIVKFMLSHTVQPKLQEKKEITVLDPACGSGTFLVEAFKEIAKYNNAEHDYEKKVNILEKQLFGIDIDKQALQIATFSLYLALLEGEDPNVIQDKIRNAYPILPSLINHTLIQGNSLLDDIYDNITYDCIITNPPWGSVPTEEKGDEEDKKERKAIGRKGEIGTLIRAKDEIITYPEYLNVSGYQRSQAFLLKVDKWCNEETICSLVVNNPIFLNDKAKDFRDELLTKYRIVYFYELSNLNKILFEKKMIGKIRINNSEKEMTVGATEPCAVLVFDKKDITNHFIQYVSPKLTKFTENFKLIHYTKKDIKKVKQTDLKKEDLLFRILVNGTWHDYQLIKQKYLKKEQLLIQCRSGFKPEKNAKKIGKSQYRDLIKPHHFERYFIKEKFEVFDWSQTLERRREEKIFQGKRILIPVRPSTNDMLKLRGIRIEGDQVHKDDIISLKIFKNKTEVKEYAYYLGILNSKFIGYYVYHISAQWGKGEMKRPKLRNNDLEKYLSFPEIKSIDEKVTKLIKLVNQIEHEKKEHKNTLSIENKIDEIVFELYELMEFEKEMVREFYQVNVDREGDFVRYDDLQKYVDEFKKVFKFILADHLALNSTYRISPNLGAFIGFKIVEKETMIPELILDKIEDNQLLNIVKKKQLTETLFSHRLNEDKVKIYDNEKFFIIKSNYFKEWTVRQAINDANEEIGLILKDLPKE